ncbi:MAG: hypothetical protein U9Q82_04625, partial [Chloroflexota bacterium]|nr:hypothetical protein [Chloroflexota bacterium]
CVLRMRTLLCHTVCTHALRAFGVVCLALHAYGNGTAACALHISILSKFSLILTFLSNTIIANLSWDETRIERTVGDYQKAIRVNYYNFTIASVQQMHY